MSMLPNFRVSFDEKLSDADTQTAIDLIKGVKGVFSVNFNEKARVASVTCGNPKSEIAAQVAQISGVKVDMRHRY